MYAVFRSGGKQYRASTGERLRLERLEVEEGGSVSFDEVLLVGEGQDVKVGTPLLAGTTVSATVLKQGKSKKVNVVKFRRRQNYLRQGTHRQFFTEVEITDISAGGSKLASKKEAPATSASDSAPAAAVKTTKKAAESKPAATKVAKKVPAKKAATKKAAPKKAAPKKD